MFCYQTFNGFTLQGCEYLDIFLRILIAYIQPELVESIRSGAISVQPNVAVFCFTKLLTIGFGNQRTGQAESLLITSQGTAYQFGTCCHVAPLIVTTQLQFDAMFLVKIKEVITL